MLHLQRRDHQFRESLWKAVCVVSASCSRVLHYYYYDVVSVSPSSPKTAILAVMAPTSFLLPMFSPCITGRTRVRNRIPKRPPISHRQIITQILLPKTHIPNPPRRSPTSHHLPPPLSWHRSRFLAASRMTLRSFSTRDFAIADHPLIPMVCLRVVPRHHNCSITAGEAVPTPKRPRWQNARCCSGNTTFPGKIC